MTVEPVDRDTRGEVSEGAPRAAALAPVTAPVRATSPAAAGEPPTAAALLARWETVVHTWPDATLAPLSSIAGAAPVVHAHLPGGPRRGLLLAGIHGDEPAGPLGLLRFLETGGAARLRARWTLDVFPLLNPLGYAAGTRGRTGCDDLNRAFGRRPRCPETASIARFVRTTIRGARGAARPAWDLVLSLHEDVDVRCVYLYDSGVRERHAFVAALRQSAAFLDAVERRGIPVCHGGFLDGDPNRGGVLLAGQRAVPALEPQLFRSGAAGRAVIVETPGRLALAARANLHAAALRHYLGSARGT